MQLATKDYLLPLRFLLGLILAAGITLSLFWGMQHLIGTADHNFSEASRGQLLDFVRLKREEIIERKKPKPKKPPPVTPAPPPPPTARFDEITPEIQKIGISATQVETKIRLGGGGFSFGAGEGDYLPLVKVAPIYPRRAASRGIAGYCIVEYTVTAQGATKGVKLVADACSHSIFEKPSLEAAGKFKYKPRIIDGQAIEVSGVRNKFTYQLED
ncbi:MAG: energy transducer TonB [Candidatus Porifericomitaceae bacterium WSBS_2022_MAG_OTU9]